MRDWLATLVQELRATHEPIVRVVVAATRGSAPRDAGACMLVSADREWGTIGGGHLEHVATQTARGMLPAPVGSTRHDRFSLGASLGQCCGGIVELSFQRYDGADLASLEKMLEDRGSAVPGETDLWLFGAGHVGRALVHVLAALPFRITWIDSREAMLPHELPAGIRGLHSPYPAEEVKGMPAGAWALIMTHSHDEDLALCEALLADGRFAWAGVIGSAPKTARFRQRLRQRGFAPEAIRRLTMPIGIGAIRSKEPAAIAIAVAAQLLQVREANVDASSGRGASARGS
jgi:xanthine dehydrogenase accessory factor